MDLQNLLDKAIAASDKNDNDEAIRIYEEILSEKEEWSTPHYNLGLIYKYRCDWGKSYKHNKHAALLEPANSAAQWNLGIASTMVGDWKLARKCWNTFGMSYDIMDEDTAGNIGLQPIRINPNDEGEVIWSRRICPARAILKNIPYPESGHRYNDLVLNDGAPNGYRQWDGKEYAVLDEIQHLKRSDYQTVSITCRLEETSQFTDLEDRCRRADIAVENWSTSIKMLCRQCSEGKPHEHHDRELIKAEDDNLIAFACLSQKILSELIEQWSCDTGVDINDRHVH